ncbi:CatB-related O-acetyltransferase [Aeromonas enteropelogenes]
MHGPDPANPHPMASFPQVCFIKNTIKGPNIEVGDYTYYDDPEDSADFERNVLYHFPFIGDKLIIGKFCAIARGVTFIMNGANHQNAGPSTYPFFIFGNGWERAAPTPSSLPYKGDTVIGNDVWIGYEALIMPGVKVGNGAIIAAKVIRYRFDDDTRARLNALAWWDWPVKQISQHVALISSGEIAELEAVAR